MRAREVEALCQSMGAAIRLAILAEREACAAVAFAMKPRIPYSGDPGYQSGHNEACEDIADAILARRTP